MRFQGALITEQGITFAVVVVQPHVVGDQKKYDQLMPILQPVFPPDTPIIVMCLNPEGVPLYYGRQDIVNFLTRVPVTAIPWRWYVTKKKTNTVEKNEDNQPEGS